MRSGRPGVGIAVAGLQRVLHDADVNAVGVVAARLVARVDAGGERPVTVTLSHGQDRVGLDPPQQVRAGGCGPRPQVVAEESAIGQQQHARQQRAQHRLGQRLLPLPVGTDRGINDGVRPALRQSQDPDLGKRPAALPREDAGRPNRCTLASVSAASRHSPSMLINRHDR